MLDRGYFCGAPGRKEKKREETELWSFGETRKLVLLPYTNLVRTRYENRVVMVRKGACVMVSLRVAVVVDL